ncbi:M48 family metalloprotease [Sphingobium sp. BYY-5]|uniref:M48 family metalloprotease n=1 Tax=Sphingobium sp. BYY-5 TaxID=2926400 RepID=UPI001FA7D726|nr:M48 family metalloprotease [Sphingobium sp. BYY-5]MCI4589710.1 M48 family metalloprotease [Sphingobium sp. BYY-5]
MGDALLSAAPFDPDAATAAYLATLSPAQHERAIAYTQGGHWLLLWGTLVTVAAMLLIWRSGLLARFAGRISGVKARPNLTAFLCTILFFLCDWAIELPWSIYANWWRERSYGLTAQSFGDWLGEDIMSTAISIPLLALLAIAIYALMRRTPRWWWAWSGLVVVVGIVLMVVVAPVTIEPLFNKYTPAPAGPTRDAAVELAHRAGVPGDKIYIYDGSKQSERYTANVSGLFGTARVAMSDTMVKQGADLAEVRGVVGHELGHYAEHHVLWLAGGMSLLAMLLFWLVDRLYPTVARWVGAGAAIGDPAHMPVAWAVAVVVGLFLVPLMNSISRYDENAADRFSLQIAHEPDGLAKALVKTIQYRASSPSRLEEILFYDHPSVERRIHAAMLWKAQHPDLVGK